MEAESTFTNYADINVSIPQFFDNKLYKKPAMGYNVMYKSFMPDNKDANILDIGCGKEFFLYYLKEYGFTNYYGIDADPSSITNTKKHITQNCEHNLADNFFLESRLHMILH